MSRFSLLLALCFLGVSMAAANLAHHGDGNLILVCPGSTCNGYDPAATTLPAECDHRDLNSTVATCTKDVYGAGTGYAQVFCANNQAHIAMYGSDALCNDGSLQKVVSQESGKCVQSTVFDCTGIKDSPLPDHLAALGHITEKYCEDEGCNTACATTRYITDKCAQGVDQKSASKFSQCNRVNDKWTTTQSSWIVEFQGEIALTCPTTLQPNVTAARPYGGCQITTEGPARYGKYVSYGCGHQDLSAASFTAPAFTLLAALAAAMLALTQ